jgi:hypothetical protein
VNILEENVEEKKYGVLNQKDIIICPKKNSIFFCQFVGVT